MFGFWKCDGIERGRVLMGWGCFMFCFDMVMCRREWINYKIGVFGVFYC